jgi:bifunctional non-homologous end joining protein LigD
MAICQPAPARSGMRCWYSAKLLGTGAARLISRKQIVYKSKPFVGLCALLADLPVQNAILDGELVCLDADGRSQFMDLMRRRREDVCYYAFDLLWLNGVDLRPLPLLDRKAELRKLVQGRPGILYADHLRGAAVELFRVCCAQDLEVKVLNPDYTQKRGRREMFEKFHERVPVPEGRTSA